jgi:FtsP/CotA-like multicopper oxidase with cupredoxin domain
MQLDPVLLTLTPAVGADGVKHRCELAAGLREGRCLGRYRIELDADRALHMRIITYTAQMFKYDLARRFLRRLKISGPRAVDMPYQYERISLDARFPGPTIRARSGRRVAVRQTNALPEHTVTHLHGGATPSDSDGFPADMDMPGTSRDYVYPNQRRGATLWYHDHEMDLTGQHTYRGLMRIMR